ncbi:MAG: winged helix-turn-helix transcriptional regulator [Halolamina sp.]
MSETRARIARHVERNPGVHFSEIVRELEVASGQVQYHTRKLVAAGDIEREAAYGKTHFFATGFEPWERRLLALFRRETARGIIGYLFEHDGASPSTVAEDLGVARSTLEWHLDRLVAEDVVSKERDIRNRVTLELTDPERTRELLRNVSPSIPDRFLDRFTRLVDSLFEAE